MTDVTVPTAPALATVPNVELMHTGTWDLMTGPATFTSADLYAAVAALDCPAVRRPPLKLGHTEPDPDEGGLRWDGEPAVGWVANLAVADGGTTLVGDYTGMPAWLGSVVASAYPDRSIEGAYDYRCQIGHLHPFVLTAVALLGVTPPGIGTIQSLQDVAALYGVAASDADPSAGTPFAVHITAAAREDRVPNPRSPEVAASVTTEDVKRAFYTSEYGKGWDIWIMEIQLGPDLQLIAIDEGSGALSRVPITVGDGDGEEAVIFGDPVKVVIRYEDATTAVAAAAGSWPEPIRFASRAESRPGERSAAAAEQLPIEVPAFSRPPEVVLRGPQWEALRAAAEANAITQTPLDASAPGVPTNTEGAGMDPALLRQALGLPPEATDEEVSTALAENNLVAPAAVTETETEVPPVAPIVPVLPEGTVTIDEAALALLQEQAAQGVAARAQQLSEDRDRTIGDAIRAGKIPPARKEHWEKAWAADSDGARTTLASLAPGLVPIADAGVPGGAETTSPDEFAEFDRLFSRPVPTGKEV